MLRVHTSKADSTGSCLGCVCTQPTNFPPKDVPQLIASARAPSPTAQRVLVCTLCVGMCTAPTFTHSVSFSPTTTPWCPALALLLARLLGSMSPKYPLGAPRAIRPFLVVVLLLLICPHVSSRSLLSAPSLGLPYPHGVLPLFGIVPSRRPPCFSILGLGCSSFVSFSTTSGPTPRDRCCSP